MHETVDRDSAVPGTALSAALQQALQPWQGAMEGLPVGACICDRDGILVRYNRRAAEIWGRPPPLGTTEFPFSGAMLMSEVLRTGEPVRDREFAFERPDGKRCVILLSLDPLLDRDGRIVGGVNCFHDVTELKRGEEMQRALLEALPAAVYTTDADGRVTFYNQAAAELAGRRPELGRDEWCVTWRLYAPDGSPMPHDQCPMAVALKENRPVRGVEALAERPDGTRVPFLPYPTPLRDASGALIGAVNMLVDVTERKQAEMDRQRLVTLVERCADFIGVADTAGNAFYINEAGRRLVGLEEFDDIGRMRVVDYFAPDERRRVDEEIMPLVAARRRWTGEIDFRHFKTAERIRVFADIFRIDDLRTGHAVNFACIARDLRHQKRTEAELRRLNETLEQRVDERTRALVAEIEERQAVEAQLHQMQKMEAVDQLTGGVAHDFNNLLTAVMANLDLIEAKTSDNDVRRRAAAALRAVKRGAKLTHQLLAFSRKQLLEAKPTNVNELVTGMGELLLRTLGGTVRVELALADRLWPALVDANQIESAILNLAINARDAMPDGGTLTIETANLRIGRLNRSADLDPGDYVMIAVADSGAGMSEEVKAKAFDPFFTTKEVGKGSGLGLSQVYGIARQSSGDVKIDSAIGRGTTVRIYFPRAAQGAQIGGLERRHAPTGSTKRRERILVIDDDDDVRGAVVASLERLGYAVGAANTGGAALEMLAAASFDALVMDFAMPGMNGVEAGRLVRSRWPRLPILFITGHADAHALGDGIAVGSVLRKPFVAADLDAKIRGLLDRNTTLAPAAVNVVRLRAETG